MKIDLGKFETLCEEDRKGVLLFVNRYIQSVSEERTAYKCEARLTEDNEYVCEEGDVIEQLSSDFVNYYCVHGFDGFKPYPCANWTAVNDAQMLEHVMEHLGLLLKE